MSEVSFLCLKTVFSASELAKSHTARPHYCGRDAILRCQACVQQRTILAIELVENAVAIMASLNPRSRASARAIAAYAP